MLLLLRDEIVVLCLDFIGPWNERLFAHVYLDVLLSCGVKMLFFREDAISHDEHRLVSSHWFTVRFEKNLYYGNVAAIHIAF